MNKLASSIAGLILLLAACKPHSNLRQRVAAQLHQELPPGSTPQRALQVLDSARVEHSGYLPDAGRIITANFGESYEFLLISSSVYVTLYFDEHNLLARIKVEEIATGP